MMLSRRRRTISLIFSPLLGFSPGEGRVIKLWAVYCAVDTIVVFKLVKIYN